MKPDIDISGTGVTVTYEMKTEGGGITGSYRWALLVGETGADALLLNLFWDMKKA